MFRVHCDELKREVLVHVSDVKGITNRDEGMLVEYRCWCGADGMLLTGSHASVERSGHLVKV